MALFSLFFWVTLGRLEDYGMIPTSDLKRKSKKSWWGASRGSGDVTDCMDGWITWEKLFQIIFVLSFPPHFSFHTYLSCRQGIRLSALFHPPFLLSFFPFLTFKTMHYEMNGGVLGKVFVYPSIYLQYLTTHYYTRKVGDGSGTGQESDFSIFFYSASDGL